MNFWKDLDFYTNSSFTCSTVIAASCRSIRQSSIFRLGHQWNIPVESYCILLCAKVPFSLVSLLPLHEWNILLPLIMQGRTYNHFCRACSEEPIKIPFLSLDDILMFPSVSTMVNISLGSCLFFPSSLRYSTCCFKNYKG